MNTDTYLNMSSVPAGAILYRIAKQKHIHQTTLAQKTGLIPQRINDLIMGRRRFTPQNSFVLEQALDISLQGFFYKIQANHDIYEAQLAESQSKPDVGLLTQTTFWDVDLSKLEWTKCQDWAIRRVLEYGTKEEIEELHRFYGHEAFAKIKENPKGFLLYDVALKNLKTVGLWGLQQVDQVQESPTGIVSLKPLSYWELKVLDLKEEVKAISSQSNE